MKVVAVNSDTVVTHPSTDVVALSTALLTDVIPENKMFFM